jgi:hypothetical protein
MNMRTKKSLFRYAGITASLAVGLTVLAGSSAGVAQASGEAFATASNQTGVIQTPIATNLQINGSGNASLELNLFVPNGSFNFGTTTGLTFVGSSTGSTIKVDGLRLDLNNALSSLTYTSSSTETVTVDAWLGSGNFAYDRVNQHVYEVVTATSTWSQAEALAASSTFDGVPGYLATITTQDEDNFILARINQDGWIGGSDDPAEGQWHWATGPETGLQFWNGEATGTPVGGQFSNWYSGEPNNQYSMNNPPDTMSSSSPYGENCAEIRVVEDSGQWNDEACNSPLPNYVVEFGAPGNLPAVVASSFTVTVTPPASVVGLQTIQAYANSMGTTTVPTIQNYIDAGITGVNSSNIAAMNLALASASAGSITNLATAQQFVTQEQVVINTALANAQRNSGNGSGVSGQSTIAIVNPVQVQSNQSLVSPAVPIVPVLPSSVITSTGMAVRDLKVGFTGEDVLMLQKILNANGAVVATTGDGSLGNETQYFGSLTKIALIKWQKTNGVTPASGYFGPITRASMKSLGLSGTWW